MAGTYNISVDQYASYSQQFTWLDGGGNPVNLTGYTADMQIGSSGITLSSVSGGIALGGSAGTITPALTPTQTAGMVPAGQANASYPYDLLMTSPSGFKTRLLKGAVNVAGGVTPS